jgi:glycosyltransferase involved in cell wall biosynthesis
LVVNEALACGRPVLVGEDCGCAPDLVDAKGTGWVVSPVELTAVAQALEQAVEQAALWPAMGERGRVVVADHTPAAMAQGVVAALGSP